MFANVRKNFGFGCMRLPMDGEKVDYAEFSRMVDPLSKTDSTISIRRTDIWMGKAKPRSAIALRRATRGSNLF